jgi:hypothetical protein
LIEKNEMLSPKDFSILFLQDSVVITHKTSTTRAVESFVHKVKPKDCICTIENFTENSFLILHISKAEPTEIYPGCEWWDRVFIGDEKIETLTCSVGNISELPEHAIQRSHKEHARFCELPIEEQQRELDFLAASKLVV